MTVPPTSERRKRMTLWFRGFYAAVRRKPCPLVDDGLTDNVPILNGYQRGGGRLVKFPALRDER